MSHEILEQKIQEKLNALHGSWLLQCVRDHKRPEPLDDDTVPGYDEVVGDYRLSLRNITSPKRYLSSYDPVNIITNLVVDDEAPKLLKLYADYLNKRSSESWLAVLEELVLVENKLNNKQKENNMLKLHWDLKIEKLNDDNKTKGVVLGEYVLSVTNAPSFTPGYKFHCSPVLPLVGGSEIVELVSSGKITELEAAVLVYGNSCDKPTSVTVGELEAALKKAEAEWFVMEQEIKNTVGKLQLHWHAGITENAKHNPVGKEVIRQPINDTQWFVLGYTDPTALHPKSIHIEPAERLMEVSREHLGVIGLLYLDIVEKDLRNPRGMKHYLMLVKEILEMEKEMEQSKMNDDNTRCVDGVTLESESLQKQDKNNQQKQGSLQPQSPKARDDKPHGAKSYSGMHSHWLFQIVDASTPKHEFGSWRVFSRDSLGDGKDLNILYKPKVNDDNGSMTLELLPRLLYPNAVITNELTSAFLKLDIPLCLGRDDLENTSAYLDLIQAVINQDFKMGMAEFEPTKVEEKPKSIEPLVAMHPVPPAYNYLVVFQDLMAPQSTVLGADWVGSFEIKPLYNVAVYRAPSESFSLMFTLDGNVSVDAVEAGAKGTGLAAQLSKLAVAHLGHTTPEWVETTKLLRACFE